MCESVCECVRVFVSVRACVCVCALNGGASFIGNSSFETRGQTSARAGEKGVQLDNYGQARPMVEQTHTGRVLAWC